MSKHKAPNPGRIAKALGAERIVSRDLLELPARVQDQPGYTLREADTVTPPVTEGDTDGFMVTPEERAELMEAIEQGRRGEGLDGWELLEELE